MKKFLCLMLTAAMLLGLVPGLAEEALKDGTYTGVGKGMHSNIAVTVDVKDGKIASVVVDSQDDTPGVCEPALETIPGAIVEANSADVEAVAGATLTSEGIKEAVRNALAGGQEGEKAAETELTLEPDMIVVGSGLAGLTSAVHGAELGLNVLVLEQSVRTGGCTYFAGGTVNGAGFKIQKENGVEDTPEAFYEDIVKLGGEGEFNEALAKTYTENVGRAVDWLDEDIGVDFADRTLVGGAYTAMDTPRVTRALGSYARGAAQGFYKPLSARLDEAIAEGKVQVMYNSKVTEILVEGDRCIGVKVGDREFRAPSVVLATGGYAHNEELVKLSGFENVISSAPSTSNGSGAEMALALGGVIDNADKIVSYYGGGIPSNGFEMLYQLNSRYVGPIYVNSEGDRVGAEDRALSSMWMDAKESKLYSILSGNMINKEQRYLTSSTAQQLPDNGWEKLEELAAEENCVIKADTLEELAEKMNMPNLIETVKAYNDGVDKGEDAFGRSVESMAKLEEGPFYAVTTVPYVWSGVSGGVRANGEGYLEREDGSVITGLSLAGEILGPSNILGNINFGGINHGMCVTWGMIAAENAAKLAGK